MGAGIHIRRGGAHRHVSGLAPASQLSKLDLTEALKKPAGSATAPGSSSRQRLRGLLGAFETATALVLLIGAGLLIRSFGKLLDVNPGFRAADLVTARVSLLGPRYSAAGARLTYFRDALSRVAALPGVRSAAFINALPLGNATSIRIGLDIEGGTKFQSENPDVGIMAGYSVVSPDYFQVMGIPSFGGRSFTDRDTEGSTPVAIVSQTLARHAWPDQNPLGKQFSFARNPARLFEVVGVVGDIRGTDLAEQPWPTVYFPILQQPQDAAFLVIHAVSNPAILKAALPGVIRPVDKDVPLSAVSTMEQLVSRSVNEPRFRTLLLGIFAGLAFLLAVVGTYGIVSLFRQPTYPRDRDPHGVGRGTA